VRDHRNSILAVAELEFGAQVNRRAPLRSVLSGEEGRKMTFIVQGVKGAGDDAVSTTVETGPGGILIRKDLQMVLVANLLAGIDVDHDGHG
jgi:hypothetical protein